MSNKIDNLRETWRTPKSMCQCGHTGDGHDSDHGSDSAIISQLSPGHGRCSVKGCGCKHFSFKAFTPEFQKALDEARK